MYILISWGWQCILMAIAVGVGTFFGACLGIRAMQTDINETLKKIKNDSINS